MRMRGKKAQITLWIIIAIIIVAVLLLIFYLTPVKDLILPTKPVLKFQDCVDEKLDEAIDLVSSKGGSINPTNAYSYQGERVEYLCYTNQYYSTCSNQQPLLRQHVEREILDYIKQDVTNCIDSTLQNLREKGYLIEGRADLSVEVVSDEIIVKISGVNIRKESTSEIYKDISVKRKSELYELLMLTSSILNWEARYGDVDITSYMIFYPNLRVEKLKQGDGSKIYKLTNTNTEDKFVFATRSLSWPAGYGYGQVHTPIK